MTLKDPQNIQGRTRGQPKTKPDAVDAELMAARRDLIASNITIEVAGKGNADAERLRREVMEFEKTLEKGIAQPEGHATFIANGIKKRDLLSDCCEIQRRRNTGSEA